MREVVHIHSLLGFGKTVISMDYDEIERDMWEQAEFERKVTAPNPSKHLQRARASIYDDIPVPQEKPEIKMVRGRPIKNYSAHDRKPGVDPGDVQTLKMIREVNGLGYGNDLIENSLKNNTCTNNNENSDRLLKCDFRPAPSIVTKSKKKDKRKKNNESSSSSSSSYMSLS